MTEKDMNCNLADGGPISLATAVALGDLIVSPDIELLNCIRTRRTRGTASRTAKEQEERITRRCSRRITLAFLPSAFQGQCVCNVPIRAGKRARG
jgi:hypothetical protein